MRIFAISDIHVDYEANRLRIGRLSKFDYQDDLLIVAGDVSHSEKLLRWTIEELVRSFGVVLFVPGNHDLWLSPEESGTSLEKFYRVCRMVEDHGASTDTHRLQSISVVPLFGWYNFSFGSPSAMLQIVWQDFRRCRWGMSLDDVTKHFLALNAERLQTKNEMIVSFSHFLPRLDIMEGHRPGKKGFLEPVLGAHGLDTQIRELDSRIHFFGHFHKRSKLEREGVVYVNNALGYPPEQPPEHSLLLQIL